jgi:PAS domain S-box-containing protein
MKSINVLLVDDDEDDYFLTSEYFEDIKNISFNIEWKSNYESAAKAISEKKYDLFIFDYFLGAKTAFDLIEIIDENQLDTPTILLTGVGDTNVDYEAADLGVYDFLVKSNLTADVLERSIRYSLKQAETLRALKASENKYRTIFEQANDVIFISDAAQNFIIVSDSISELTGYTQEEILKIKTYDLIEGSAILTDIVSALKEEHEIRDLPIQIKTKGGPTKSCLLSCKVVDTPADGVYVHGIISDQTHRLKAERESLMNEKIQSTARLMRTLAHEVRNPLTNINLAAESLEAETEDDFLDIYIDIIKRNATRIDTLITEVLNSAKQKEVQTTLQPIEPIVEKAIRNVKDRADFQGIIISQQLKTDNILIPLSAPQFEIVLNNLLINAIEALENTKDAKVTISGKIEGDWLVLKVKDNGSGIDKDKIEHLFEPYFTSKNNGIGLGLSATLNIIQAHQASIDVKSELNIGTTFEISLPLNKKK